jgi:predicted alpha/beta superfamily hydrolase
MTHVKTNARQRALAMLCLLLTLTFNTKAQVTDSARTRGMEVKTLYSTILGEKRTIRIQTPASTNPYDTYPVLYVLDGEVQTALIAGQVQYLSEGYMILPKMIVVGIDNTDRTRDLTPTHAAVGKDGKPDTSATAFGRTSGGGERFLKFINEEVRPYIEQQYPAAPYRILYGHSLGGLMAIHCLLQHPDYFHAYIAVSPSLQWDKEVLLRMAAEKLNSQTILNKRLFFSDANEDATFHARQLQLDSLLRSRQPKELVYKRLFYPDETHTTEPVKAFYDGIRFLYPSWHLPYSTTAFRNTMTADSIKNHFKRLSDMYGYTVVPPHDEMNQVSRFLRNDPNRINDAIELLQMNAEHFPSSAVVLETLGDTYLKAGNTQRALQSFQRALVLNPASSILSQKIKQLQ